MHSVNPRIGLSHAIGIEILFLLQFLLHAVKRTLARHARIVRSIAGGRLRTIFDDTVFYTTSVLLALSSFQRGRVVVEDTFGAGILRAEPIGNGKVDRNRANRPSLIL